MARRYEVLNILYYHVKRVKSGSIRVVLGRKMDLFYILKTVGRKVDTFYAKLPRVNLARVYFNNTVVRTHYHTHELFIWGKGAPLCPLPHFLSIKRGNFKIQDL